MAETKGDSRMKEVIVKEVIELLKKALKEKSKIEPDYSEHTIKLAADMMMVYIEEALALLRPCGTCGETGQIGDEIVKYGRSMGYKECPDCQEPADGTIAIETLKKIDKACGDKLSHDEPAEKPKRRKGKHKLIYDKGKRTIVAYCKKHDVYYQPSGECPKCHTIIKAV